MPVVIYAPHKDGLHDGRRSHKQTIGVPLEALPGRQLPGLHIEPIKGAIDTKVRTGRVNDMYRAVLFKVQSSAGAPHYIFTGVWPHDKAISIAEKAVLKTNPVNGLPELLLGPPSSGVRPDPGLDSGDGRRERRSRRTPVPVPRVREPRHHPGSADRRARARSDVAARALAATSEDELSTRRQTRRMAGMALLELTVGATIEQAGELAGWLDAAASIRRKGRGRPLVAALKTPGGDSMQFAWLEDHEELRARDRGRRLRRMEGVPAPRAAQVRRGRYSGAFRLQAAPAPARPWCCSTGRGMLAKRDPPARVVLTTYTRNLAEGMKRRPSVPRPVTLSCRVRGSQGSTSRASTLQRAQVSCSAGPDELDQAVADGAGRRRQPRGRSAETKETAPGVRPSSRRGRGSRRRAQLRVPHRRVRRSGASPAHHDKDEYLRVRRPGRGVALGRAQRALVWEVIRTPTAVSGCWSSWRWSTSARCARSQRAARTSCDAGTPAARRPRSGGRGPGPDRGPLAVPARGGSGWPERPLHRRGLAAEDLRSAHHLGRHRIRSLARSRRLSLNYRTTTRCCAFATSSSRGGLRRPRRRGDGRRVGYRSARSGPVPIRVATGSIKTDELDRAAKQAWTEWLAGGSGLATALGSSWRDQRSALSAWREGFEKIGTSACRQVSEKSAATGKDPQLMTMHRAKGMEFTHVLIFGANADLLPAAYLLKDLPEEERADLLQRERSLFYVAATRARNSS